jgi:hypothetical protein
LLIISIFFCSRWMFNHYCCNLIHYSYHI